MYWPSIAETYHEYYSNDDYEHEGHDDHGHEEHDDHE